MLIQESFVKRVDDKTAAKIEYGEEGAYLMILNNGYCSIADIQSIGAARAAVEVISQYIEILESKEG